MLTDSPSPICGDVTLNKRRQRLLLLHILLLSNVAIDFCFTLYAGNALFLFTELKGPISSFRYFLSFHTPVEQPGTINYPRKASTDLQDLQVAVRGGVFSLTWKWY